MLFTARSEAQRAADSAALAGAGALIFADPDDPAAAEDRARQVAIQFGNANTVRNDQAQVLSEDVEVDLAESQVTVTVRRIGDRGSAVGTWFARVFGVDEVDVAALATAEVAPAGSARCVKPFSLPDRFDDNDGDGEFDPGDEYDPAIHGYGSSWRNAGQPGDDGLGYVNDFGRPVIIKQGGPGLQQPSWYAPWDMPQPGGGPATGADRYRENIATCNPSIITVGVEYMEENGNMDGPTRQGTADLIALDPDAYWDVGDNVVAGSAWDPAWEGTPRIGVVPTYHPGRVFTPGKKPIVFTNFVAVFIESVQGNGNNQKVYGRLLYPAGVGGGEAVAPNLKFVRLIK
jgi:hypothetical protein